MTTSDVRLDADEAKPGDRHMQMSLREVFQFIARAWRFILFGALGGLFAATAYLGVTPARFQAQAVVGLVKAGQTQIESAERTMERVASPAFQQAVLKTLGWQQDARGNMLRKSLSAARVDADHVRLSVLASNADDAARAINASVQELKMARSRITLTSSQAVQKELDGLVREIGELDRSLALLRRIAKTTPETSRSDLLLLLSVEGSQKARLYELRREERSVRSQLFSGDTGETISLVEELVPQTPVSPKKLQVIVLVTLAGMFAGLIAGGLWGALWRRP